MTTKIGHYDLVTELGRGGMGVVYKGHEAALNRYVAIKMLSPQLAHDESIKERFLREARSMAALNDPHIIQVYFIGEDAGQPFFAMEFVEGESLSSFLKRDGRLTPQQAARVIYQTAQGLAVAHDRGVIHRDIKPGNLMLDQRGRIKIADFGIALSATDFSKKLTSTGEFVGTPGYLSPEVCTGEAVDLRSDIFSLGIVFFEMLTGRMPFTDESPLGLLLEVVRAEIPDVRELNSEVDEGLVAVLRRMTAKDPADRFQNCHELVEELARHPLVAGANTVSAAPVLSAAAGTMVGQKTPPQIKRATPAPVYATEQQARPATPAPEPTMEVPPPVRRPSVLESQGQRDQQRRGSAVWPIAAVLVLGGAIAGGWAFRDKIPGLNTLGSGGASTTAATTAPATTSPAASSSTTAAVPTASPAVTAPPATNVPPTLATGDASVAANNAPAVDPSANAPVAPTTPTTVAVVDTQPDPSQGIAGAQDPAGEAPADAEALGPLRRMAETRKDELARAEPPPPRREPARDVGPPKIAVVAFGDPAIGSPARQIVEEELINAGYIVADSDLLGIGGATKADMPAVFADLQRAGVKAVAVINVEGIGETQLNFYGQSQTQFNAAMTVRTYDVRNRSPLFGGGRTKVDFTSLNAEQMAREAIEPELRRMMSSLSAYKPGARRG